LHSCLHSIQWLGNVAVDITLVIDPAGFISQVTGAAQVAKNIHSDNTSHTTNGKGTQRSQLLTRRNIALSKLLQSGVGRESSRRIGSLSGRSRYKALEETLNTSFLPDDLATVQETAHARLLGLAVVNQLGLNTLERSNGQKRLGEASTKASNNGPGAGDLAVLILEGCLDSVESDESYNRQTPQSVH
jgi:hypothetical protein